MQPGDSATVTYSEIIRIFVVSEGLSTKDAGFFDHTKARTKFKRYDSTYTLRAVER